MSGVYFIRDLTTGLIKIGVSKRPHTRMRALMTAAAGGLQPIGAVEGDRDLESQVHRELKAWRSHREWFHPSDAVETYITKMLEVRTSVDVDQCLEQAMDAHSVQAAEWVSALIRRDDAHLSDTDDEKCIDRVARRIGISRGLARNLHYKRTCRIAAGDFEKIRSYYIFDIERRTKALIEQADAVLDIVLYRDPAVLRLEAVIADASALLSEMTGGRP